MPLSFSADEVVSDIGISFYAALKHVCPSGSHLIFSWTFTLPSAEFPLLNDESSDNENDEQSCVTW